MTYKHTTTSGLRFPSPLVTTDTVQTRHSMVFTPTQSPPAATAPQNVRPDTPVAGNPAIDFMKSVAQASGQPPDHDKVQTSEVDDEKMAQEAAAAELRRSTRLQGCRTPNMNEQALEDAQLSAAAKAKPERKKSKRRKSAHPVPHQRMDTEEATDSAASMDLQASAGIIRRARNRPATHK